MKSSKILIGTVEEPV